MKPSVLPTHVKGSVNSEDADNDRSRNRRWTCSTFDESNFNGADDMDN